MNVEQRPSEKEFSATMTDYIIDSDAGVTFAVKYNNKTMLEEEYIPDADFKIKVRKLGKFCAQALWGQWCPVPITMLAYSLLPGRVILRFTSLSHTAVAACLFVCRRLNRT
ncbi:hypothetical protein EZS27_044437 [termite gut metagenome]|uniref:Uncharacterized protein n=1 Tax=termite gut metagenome TaxID=433724 RepID=A0A5J4P5L1_9ZZZZ